MTVTPIAATVTATQVFPVDAGRKGLVLENTDTNRCYVLLGPGTVSSTNFSFSLAQNDNALLANCRECVSVVWGTASTGQLLATSY
jgi:hypothetical protein